jgi:hypothetical protein
VPVLIVVMELTEDRDRVLALVMMLGARPLELELVKKLGGLYLELEVVVKLGVRCFELELVITLGIRSLELELKERLLKLIGVISSRLLPSVIDRVAELREARLLLATLCGVLAVGEARELELLIGCGNHS